MSNLLEKVKDKVEAVLHKDGHHDSHTHTSTGPAHHPHTTTTGTGVGTGAGTGAYDTSNTTGAGYGSTSTNAGPHNSNIANKLDPRVDSDRDGSYTAGTGAGTGAYNTSTTTGAGYGSSNVGGGYGSTSTNAGPHDSNLANKLDPRVDSSNTTGTGAYNSSTTTGAGYGSSNVGGGYGSTSTNAGPHDSNIANKLDPRVDSDLDGSRNLGGVNTGGAYNTSTTGAGYGSSNVGGGYGSSNTTSTNAGPHDSNLLNKLDPRVDSDRDGSYTANTAGTATGGTYGSSNVGGGYGSTNTTSTGPHDSNLLNKLDPRVDSQTGTTGTGYNSNNNPTY